MCKKLERLKSSLKRELSYNEDNKKEYKLAATAVLKEVVKKLNFKESKVYFNPGGIAVSGDAILMGLWEEGKGVYVDICGADEIMFRSIKHMKDYTGGPNHWLNLSRVENIDTLSEVFKSVC